MHLELVFQLVINGLLLGGVFALAALGLNVIFGVTRIVNLAHGQIIILTALTCAVVFQKFGITPIEALPVALVAGAILGILIERTLLQRLPEHAQSREWTSLLITFGVSYFLIGLSLALFSGDFRSVAYLTDSWRVGSIDFPKAQLLAFVLAIFIAGILGVVLRSTQVGRALRAASQNLDGARVCGIDISRMRTLSFALGSAIAAASGALLSMIYAYNPDTGSQFTLIAFSVVVLGGLGSYAGAIVGALLLGLAVSFVGFYGNTHLGSMMPYVVFILVLLFRPSGILGKPATT
ncbi:MAG TPA: branched-chain amino acid ABC transporter permease [Candidatus Acidoferrales bacterium]|nr:branched-chain amino acid ABC transporter permease [Candidatus Acidoferrales bacterium]